MTATLDDNDPRVLLARGACRLIEEHLEEPLTLTDLGIQLGLSPAHLQRVFKKVTGITPRQYADACRLGKLKTRLKQQRTVTMAMYEAVYGSSRRLYERAGRQLGMTPATYQRGGKHVAVSYTIVDCPLGRLLMAGTERGICALSLADGDMILEEFLTREFP